MFGWMRQTTQTHRTAEFGGLYEGGYTTVHGLIAGTHIASHLGWRPIEGIAVGDMVLTFDNGMVRVADVKRTTLWPCATEVPHQHWPVRVPAGALSNQHDVTVLPNQAVLVESDAAIDAYGDPFAIVRAKALDGLRGAHRVVPLGQIDVVTLIFEEDQIIYVEGGLLAFCPCAHRSLTDVIAGEGQTYEVLNEKDAAFLARCIEAEDAAARPA